MLRFDYLHCQPFIACIISSSIAVVFRSLLEIYLHNSLPINIKFLASIRIYCPNNHLFSFLLHKILPIFFLSFVLRIDDPKIEKVLVLLLN